MNPAFPPRFLNDLQVVDRFKRPYKAHRNRILSVLAMASWVAIGVGMAQGKNVLAQVNQIGASPSVEDSKAPDNRLEFSNATEFVSTSSRVIGRYIPRSNDRSVTAQAAAANRLLELLSDEQREMAVRRLDDPERKQWTNLPARPDAGGIRLGLLDEQQVQAVCDLMSTLLSQEGYEKMRLIMLADDQLLNGGQSRPGFGSEWFSIVIFGRPSPERTWAFQLDGHHIGLNLTIQGDRMTMGPSFIGTQPVSYELGGHRIRPLRFEADRAYALVNQLSNDQFREALVSDRRSRIQGGPGRDSFRPQPAGLACRDMNAKQREMLESLISSWIDILPPKQARMRMDQIRSDRDQTYFSWHGAKTAGSDVSYMIQSPSLLIEFAYQDLGGNPLQHLHTQYRHLKNDYGQQFNEK